MPRMKEKLKWAAVSFAAIFLLLQFTNPARTNPPVIRDFIAAENPPADVAASIRAACYDCHSHETKWPLYSRIAPSSWLVVNDVNEGREHLDLSDWPDDSARAAKKLDRINEELDYREMPPKKYTLLHPEARLTEAQRKAIMDWTDAEEKKLQPAGLQN
jgi:Haem-binding domain